MQLDDMKTLIRGDDYLCYMAAILFVEARAIYDNRKDYPDVYLSYLEGKLIEWDGMVQTAALQTAKKNLAKHLETIATKAQNTFQSKVDSSGEQP